MTTDVPGRLLARLEALGRILSDRGDALALLGLGSVGADLGRLDDHSDLDFFVVVEDGAKAAYLADIDWLKALGPIAFEFENTVDGRKVLFEDGVYRAFRPPTESETFHLPAQRFAWGDLLRGERARPGHLLHRRDGGGRDLDRNPRPGIHPHRIGLARFR